MKQHNIKIIISPAKKMKRNEDFMEPGNQPVFLHETERISSILQGYSLEKLQRLFAANDSITKMNYQRYQQMDLYHGQTPAVLAYLGLQYQSMAPDVFTAGEWEYVQKHLNILSGFYGLLRACDGVVPYRLEMQAKLSVDNSKDLYGFWGERIYKELVKDGGIILNLASKEYSKAVEPYIGEDNRFITCVFGHEADGRVIVKATEAKMARGAMVRWMAREQIENIHQVKEFPEMNYEYREQLSTDVRWVFVKRVQ